MAIYSFGHQIAGIDNCYETFRMVLLKLQWECYRVTLGLALMLSNFTERSKLHTYLGSIMDLGRSSEVVKLLTWLMLDRRFAKGLL